MRTGLVAVIGLAMLCGVACKGSDDAGAPALEGFFSGGFGGFECPPASSSTDSCSDPDCGVGCTADTPCDPDKPDCPAGYECNDSSGSPYCLPAKTCESKCSDGEHCAHFGLSNGICVAVDPADLTSPSCQSTADCEWPFVCRDETCDLSCSKDECPTGSTCMDGRCLAAN